MPIGPVIERFRPKLGENDAAFLARVYSRPIEDYAARLAGWGFSDLGRVLDAGCGFGQWSAGLAQQNQAVESVDVSEERVEVVRAVAEALELPGLSACPSRLDTLPFPDAHFDGVFCYGVLFLTGWREALAELTRVLAPGGLLYLNANGFGWYRHMWYDQPNRALDYEPREHVARVFDNTWRYERGLPIEEGFGILIEPEELEAELDGLDYGAIERGAESELSRPADGSSFEPFFPGRYGEELGVYELLARKR